MGNVEGAYDVRQDQFPDGREILIEERFREPVACVGAQNIHLSGLKQSLERIDALGGGEVRLQRVEDGVAKLTVSLIEWPVGGENELVAIRLRQFGEFKANT